MTHAGADDLDLITHGRMEIEGRLLDASNATLYCAIELDGRVGNAVYKPVAGERPLWDFPDGTLAGREVATYLIAAEGELGRVPPTVLRDGPLGRGMVQLWIEALDAELVDVRRQHDVPPKWRRVLYAHDRFGEPVVLAHADRADLAELALLDVVVNNTDRKGSHVLHDQEGQVWGVDHGICLHTEPKLRTVLWGWAGLPLPEHSIAKLGKLRAAVDDALGARLATHLTAAEVRAVGDRIDLLLDHGVYPAPADDARAVPWPLL